MVAMAASRAGVSNSPAATAPREGRLSNGLKEFLVQLDGIGHGHLLDLGPARQTTPSHSSSNAATSVYVLGILRLTGWKHFLDSGDQNESKRVPPASGSAGSHGGFPAPKKFLESTLGYANQTFDAVLMWDLLDYLDNEIWLPG